MAQQSELEGGENTQRKSDGVAYQVCDQSLPVPAIQPSSLNLRGAAGLSPEEKPEEMKGKK